MDPFVIRAEATISTRALQRLKSGHLWVYKADVIRVRTHGREPIVRVVDESRNPVGFAFYNPASQIMLRLLTRGTHEPSVQLFRERIQASIFRRRRIVDARKACRLVFGEADLLPSIVVDMYGDHLVLQTLCYGADQIKPLLVEILLELLNPRGIVERNDTKTRLLEGLSESRGILWGAVPPQVEISEGGTRFLVDPLNGQKTGFYLDQSENRIAVREYAFGRGLDCFSNTGAFALSMACRCESVLAADISSRSIEQARRNAALNGARNTLFHEANAFDFLRQLEVRGEKFDILCLDPPAFAKSKRSLAGALGGYKEINLRAMKILRPEGILASCSCSYHMPESQLLSVINQAAEDAHRTIQILEKRSQSPDHPVLLGMPETHYLKCFILRVL